MVKLYLSANRYLQISSERGDPNMGAMAWLKYVIKSLKKKVGGRMTRTRRPITRTELEILRERWEQDPNRADATILWAAAALCFWGFLRSGEVVASSETQFDPSVNLAYGDVRVDSVADPHYLAVVIKGSKTDMFRKGTTVYLGRTKMKLCPVAADLSYMALRGPAPGPFFTYHSGSFLTRPRFVEEV